MRRLVACYRSPTYSPNQHRANDTAILDATVSYLAADGWAVARVGEREVEADALPDGDLYVNMCQGALASERLRALEGGGARVVNAASSVLGCHRHRLVPAMTSAGIAFPRTTIVQTDDGAALRDWVRDLDAAEGRVWVKRGDVHAERTDDVVSVTEDGVGAALAAFRARGIARAAVQEHIPGPILKFYAVRDGSFFRYYDAEAGLGGPVPRVDEERLKALAYRAAGVLGLDVFGGDVAFPAPDRPVLIDINDWPSFAPFRDEAARCIAGFLHHHASNGARS